MDLFGLDVLGIDAVVADVRIREGHDLPAIARVSEDFLVAGDGGVEHHFADRGAGGTDGIAEKDRAVCERQDGVRVISLERQKHWVLRWLRARPRTYRKRVLAAAFERDVRPEMRWGGWISEQSEIIADSLFPVPRPGPAY